MFAHMPDQPTAIRVGIIAGSTRAGRKSIAVAQWLQSIAAARPDESYEIIDIADFALPLVDEPFPPASGRREKPHTMRWAAAIASFEGFVLITPEYNHSPSAALRNALDFLHDEWADKAVAFVNYGADGGVRAVEHLRQIAGELQLADIRPSVSLSFAADFENYTTFAPRADREQAAATMLRDLARWTRALTPLLGSAAVLSAG